MAHLTPPVGPSDVPADPFHEVGERLESQRFWRRCVLELTMLYRRIDGAGQEPRAFAVIRPVHAEKIAVRMQAQDVIKPDTMPATKQPSRDYRRAQHAEVARYCGSIWTVTCVLSCG